MKWGHCDFLWGLGKVRTVRPSVGGGMVTEEGILCCLKCHSLTCKIIFSHLEFYEGFKRIFIKKSRERDGLYWYFRYYSLLRSRDAFTSIWKGVILNIRDFK